MLLRRNQRSGRCAKNKLHSKHFALSAFCNGMGQYLFVYTHTYMSKIVHWHLVIYQKQAYQFCKVLYTSPHPEIHPSIPLLVVLHSSMTGYFFIPLERGFAYKALSYFSARQSLLLLHSLTIHHTNIQIRKYPPI